MRRSLQGRPAVLIAGGGVAALEAAIALHELAGDAVRVDLLSPEPAFWVRPAAVAQPFALGAPRHFDLSTLAASVGAAVVPGTLFAVDADRHEAHAQSAGVLRYDRLLLACGAVPTVAVPGALTFRGPADIEAFARLLAEIEDGTATRVAFVVPRGAAWALPLYELALLTGARVAQLGLAGVELSLVTPERRPLELFGWRASDTVFELLDERGIAVHLQSHADAFASGELTLLGGTALAADRAVALPRLRGPRIDGLPQTVEGFVTVDEHGRVPGIEDVFAAGDVTAFPVKQGGIAAQQADAAAEAIAAGLGLLGDEPQPFRPMLRGLLLTGRKPRYLRRDLSGDTVSSWVSETPIWWPPTKLVGRRLAPFLAQFAGAEPTEEPPEGAVEVEIELASSEATPVRPSAPRAQTDRPTARVADVLRGDPQVVAPEDTLGEVAERMIRLNVDAALVAEYGALIGILTSRDLLRAAAARVHPSDARVRHWMTAEPVAVTPDTGVEAAQLLLREYGIDRLAVVDGRRPVGAVDADDLAGAGDRAAGPAVGLGF
jgi:sulfide:quinone oxidoreductase